MVEIEREKVKSGMTIRVHQKIKEEGKEKTQIIEGLVIARKHGSEPGATITIRKVIDGVGVEWILPLFSPKIEKIELVKEGKTRRNKLYYIRKKSQTEIRKKLKAEMRKLEREPILEEKSKENEEQIIKESEKSSPEEPKSEKE